MLYIRTLSSVAEPSHHLDRFPGLTECLGQHEKITCFDTAGFFAVAGTSLGSLLVFDLEGHLIVRRREVHKGAVTCVRAVGGGGGTGVEERPTGEGWRGGVMPAPVDARDNTCFLVVSGGRDGRLQTYEWSTNAVAEFGSGRLSGTPTTLALSERFSSSGGHVYYGTDRGMVACRKRGLMFGFDDSVLFNGTLDAHSDMFDDPQWLQRESRRGGPAPVPILSMTYAPPMLTFGWNGLLCVYSERRDSVVARFSSGACRYIDQPVPLDRARSAPDPHARQSATPPRRAPRGRSPTGTEASSVVGSPYSVASTSARMERAVWQDNCRALIHASYLVVLCGKRLYFCNTDWDHEPFSVLQVLDLPEPLTGIESFVNDTLLLSWNFRAPRDLGAQVGDLPMHSSQASAVPETPGGGPGDQVTRTVVAVYDFCDIRSNMSCLGMFTIENPLRGVKLSVCRGVACTDAYADNPTIKSPPSHTLEFAYVVSATDIFVIKPLRAAERIVWLVRNKQFPRALQLCKNHHKAELATEIANEYACHLWEDKKDYQSAMEIWADYLLPTANSAYWTQFASRLDRLGKLPMLEKYLPFNNRNILPTSYYIKVLESYIQSECYSGLYNCVVRWPAVYPMSALAERVTETLVRLRNARVFLLGRVPGDDEADAWVVEESSGEDDDGEVADSSHVYLWKCLFKLFEFQNKHDLAFLALLALKETSVFDYVIAQNLSERVFVAGSTRGEGPTREGGKGGDDEEGSTQSEEPIWTNLSVDVPLKKVLEELFRIDAARAVSLTLEHQDKIDVCRLSQCIKNNAAWYKLFLLAHTEIRIQSTAPLHTEICGLIIGEIVANDTAGEDMRRDSVASMASVDSRGDPPPVTSKALLERLLLESSAYNKVEVLNVLRDGGMDQLTAVVEERMSEDEQLKDW